MQKTPLPKPVMRCVLIVPLASVGDGSVTVMSQTSSADGLIQPFLAMS